MNGGIRPAALLEDNEQGSEAYLRASSPSISYEDYERFEDAWHRAANERA